MTMTPGLSFAVTAPAAAGSILTLAEAKTHLKILHGREDAEITAQIGVAEDYAESHTGMALRRTGYEGALAAFPLSREIRLPWPPLVAVVSVEYLDPDGARLTLDPAGYVVVARGLDARIVLAPGADWPATAMHPEAVVVAWTAGFDPADAGDARRLSKAKQAIKLLVGTWYTNREALADERGRSQAAPHSVESLLAPYLTKGWI